MHTHITTIFSSSTLRMLSFATICIVGSFVLGIQTAGEVQPVTLIEAGSIKQAGDVDGNGTVDIEDAILILEIAQGYRSAEVTQLKSDPNGDGQLTVDDAIAILEKLSLQ